MRTIGMILCGGLLLTAALQAQGPPPQNPANNPLDQVLDQWEKTMSGLKSFVAQINRTAIDPTFKTTEVWTGQARFLKGQPGTTSRASLYLSKVLNPPPAKVEAPFERFIYTGNFLYQFSQATKEIIVHEVPPPKGGQVADDNILAFLFGRKADEAKKRYQMTYLKVSPEQAKYYHFISIKPLQAQDKSDFSEARLVLMASNFLPRQFWYRQPNGNEVSWDFPNVWPNAEVSPLEFAQPAVPAGWKMTKPPPQQLKVRN